MTVTSQRPLKILIRYKKRSLSSISLFLKVKWPSDSIKSGQLPTKCFGFGKYNINTNNNITNKGLGRADVIFIQKTKHLVEVDRS